MTLFPSAISDTDAILAELRDSPVINVIANELLLMRAAARAQGRAEGMEEAARIAEIHAAQKRCWRDYTEANEAEYIAAAILQAAKKGA